MYLSVFSFLWRCGPTRAMASSFLRFLDHTQRRTTVGRTPLDEWSARRRDLYLTTHNTHNRQTPMSPVGFEPTISTGERPQTYALGRADTGTGNYQYIIIIIMIIINTNKSYWAIFGKQLSKPYGVLDYQGANGQDPDYHRNQCIARICI